MARVVGDISIQVGADIGPLVRDLGKGSAAVGKFGGSVDRMSSGFKSATVAGTAVATAIIAAGTAVAALTKRAMDNIDVMSKQARAAGISVTSFQAMAQVAEEAGVEADKLSSVLTKMQKNIAELQQGTQSQVQAFGRLGVSVSDLAGKNADEQFKVIAEALAALSDPTTKTAAALEVFGKSGASVINMLDGYGAAVANAAKFQRDFGISVNDMDAQQIEAANDALGRLGMAMDGLGNSLAVTFAPSITAAAEGLTGFITNLNSASNELNAVFENADRAKSILGEEMFNALMNNKQAAQDSQETLKDLNYTYRDLARTAKATGEAISNEGQNLLDVGADELAIQLVDVGGRMYDLVDQFNLGHIKAAEFKKGLSETALEAQRLLEEASKIDGVDMGGAINQIGLLSDALSLAVGVAKTLVANLPGGSRAPDSGQSDDKAQSLADRRAGVISPLAPTSSPRPQSAPYFDGFGSFGGGGGGGGGGGESLQDRLKKMQDDFASEQEVIQAQYEERLAELEAFRQQKLLTEEEYNKLEQDLKSEHNEKLASLDAWRYGDGLDKARMFFGAAADIAAAGGEKALKISKGLAAAEAFISTYQGAAKELEKGTLGFASAAAVIAKGVAFVAAIQSTTSSGGGKSRGGGGGGGSSAPAPAAKQPSTYFNVSLTGGDSYGGSQIRNLISEINKEIENGAVIKGIKVT